MSAPSSRLLRLLAATLLLVGGAIHTWLAFDGYGTGDLEQLFFVNGAASAVVAGALALSRNPVPALAGAGIAAGSLGAFVLSRIGSGVVGFRGTGLDPFPEVPLTLVVEAAALVVIALWLFRRADWIRSNSVNPRNRTGDPFSSRA